MGKVAVTRAKIRGDVSFDQFVAKQCLPDGTWRSDTMYWVEFNIDRRMDLLLTFDRTALQEYYQLIDIAVRCFLEIEDEKGLRKLERRVFRETTRIFDRAHFLPRTSQKYLYVEASLTAVLSLVHIARKACRA